MLTVATPLSDVTFAVIDLETTGTAPGQNRIIEVGAAKFRGGECLGTFQTLVDPGCEVPPFITVLTGITQAVLVPAPPIEEVLPTLLEFLGDAVLVGHNLRFDTSFLDAALLATGRRPLHQPRVDTLTLARSLMSDEVPNRRLATLARFFHTATQPTHRALDDVLATVGVLHGLLERAGTFGIVALDDLLALPSTPQALARLPLAARLPRRPGVYLFEDAGGRVLHVGRAGDLRARVRAYFTSGDRRWRRLVRETARIDHVVCAHPLEAAVVQARLTHAHQPTFDRPGRRRAASAYVKVTTERHPRLLVVHRPRDDGALYLGPLPSTASAHLVREAIQAASELPGLAGRGGGARTGVVRRSLGPEPWLLLGPLADRMQALAAARRFDEAILTRQRHEALAEALRRQRTLDTVRAAGRVVVESGGNRLVIDGGRLETIGLPGPAGPLTPLPAPLGRAEADEILIVGRWLEREAAAGRLRLVHSDAPLDALWPPPAAVDEARPAA
ncbi:MAG: exonuclease domain-containing protein [Actinomycetota bacterium]|nr:exonuclease domain-containing protein [Actinomycetota bacterium]